MSNAVAGWTADTQRISDRTRAKTPRVRYALLGHPNTGRTTLFNRLCGLRTKTGNYPGTTTGIRIGRCKTGAQDVHLADLPAAAAGAVSSFGATREGRHCWTSST